MHSSVTVDELDVVALKKPTLHALHSGARTDDPATTVNSPDPHFVCAMHTSFASADLPVGAVPRKKPLAQAVHCVSRLGVPAASVHSPREHVLWIPEHASASDASFALEFGAFTRNLPLLHVAHCVSVVELPPREVHSPAEQVLCDKHTCVSFSAVLPLGADARKRPELQGVHCVSLLLLPAI